MKKQKKREKEAISLNYTYISVEVLAIDATCKHPRSCGPEEMVILAERAFPGCEWRLTENGVEVRNKKGGKKVSK